MMVYHGEMACHPASQICIVDGCEKPVYIKKAGFCTTHYQRWRQHGDPLGFTPRAKPEVTHPLALKLCELSESTGLSRDAITVFARKNDPYRVDTPDNHRDAQWFKEQMEAHNITRLHNRGLHYVFLGATRPRTGQPYVSDRASWKWLVETSKAARWLGYIPFEAIEDARNAAPVIRPYEERVMMVPRPCVYLVGAGSGIDLATSLDSIAAIDFKPFVHQDFRAPPQPYRLVLWGEKSSLETVLDPIAGRYQADLYLPTGETSDTLLYLMAKTGAEDGREMVVFVLADADPSGFQMAISIAHKLRAFRDWLFPDLRFRVIPTCLTVEQVHELRLPGTPLAEGEKRKWREKHGFDQVEIDALATLRPDVLRRIVHDAITPYYDNTLSSRVYQAQQAWHDEARSAIETTLDGSGFDEAKAEAEAEIKILADKLAELAGALTDKISGNYHHLDSMVQKLCPPEKLPPVKIPEVDLPEPPEPFVSSEMDLGEHVEILRARKDYAEKEDDDED